MQPHTYASAGMNAFWPAHANADVVPHLAGQVSVVASINDPRYDFEMNALGTFNALEATSSRLSCTGGYPCSKGAADYGMSAITSKAQRLLERKPATEVIAGLHEI